MDDSIIPRGSTRHIRVDQHFLDLLEEDFGIDSYSLQKAFFGVPPAPKKQAVVMCEWAVRVSEGDVEEAGKALRAWAQKRGVGLYNPVLLDAPPPTYDDGGRECA